MAEQTEPKKRTVRKVRTVREQAEHAMESSQQPRRLHTTKRKVGAPFRFIGARLKPLGKFKVVRIIGIVLLPPYFRNSWRELRKVTWPAPRESLRLTSAVFIFAIIFGVTIALVDFGLDKLFKEVLLK